MLETNSIYLFKPALFMQIPLLLLLTQLWVFSAYDPWSHSLRSRHPEKTLPEAQRTLADYPALSVDRAGGGNPLYAEDTPNQEFLIWCAPIQEFLIRCTPIQEFEFTDSVLVFVRGVIWHQEGYYCYIISQMNTFIINKIFPRKCLPLLTACRHLWQLHLVVLKFIQRNDTSRWRSFYCVRKL